MLLPNNDYQTITRNNPTSSPDRLPYLVSYNVSLSMRVHFMRLLKPLTTVISRPSLRDRLVFTHQIYSTGAFSRAYSICLRFNWPFKDADILVYNQVSQSWGLSELFERYACDLSNWTMTDDFFDGFIEMSLDIPSKGERSITI